jgi:5-aminopentanamidase
MPSIIKVGVFQFAPIFGETKKNTDYAVEELSRVQADLVVLPELCTTGYQFVSREEVRALSEEVSTSYAVARFMEVARAQHMGIVFGMAEVHEGRFFNSAVYLSPNGLAGVYRKVHLFFEEKFFFEGGRDGFPVFEQDGVRLGIMICFDWIFPEAARILALKGADIICHPSNLVLPFCQDAMVTRCTENRVFAVTANRIGEEQRGGKDKLAFSGASQVADPGGNVLFRLAPGEETLRIIEIEPGQARNKNITIHNDLFHDRAPKLYKNLVED